MSRASPVIGFFSCLAVAWIITYFVGMEGTFAQDLLMTFIGTGTHPIPAFMNAICSAQIAAYVLMQIGKFGAVSALAVGGLVGGLVSRRLLSAIGISIVYLAFLFICPYVIFIVTGFTPMGAILLMFGIFFEPDIDIAISIIVAFLVLLILGIAGASITAERK